MRELILGSGNAKKKRITTNDNWEYTNPFTVDISSDCNPDLVWDLNNRPLPFKDEFFDEIHAYEILEHIGKQGDYKALFEEFTEYHRILKPGGIIAASVPKWDSVWAWGDPGHTRVISEGTLIFLNQNEYLRQLGTNSMTDYRNIYKVSFKNVYSAKDEENFFFILEKE